MDAVDAVLDHVQALAFAEFHRLLCHSIVGLWCNLFYFVEPGVGISVRADFTYDIGETDPIRGLDELAAEGAGGGYGLPLGFTQNWGWASAAASRGLKMLGFERSRIRALF